MANKRLFADNINIISFVLELIAISILAFFLTLFNAGFDITKINWTIFAFTDVFNIYCRVIATKYASNKEKKENLDIATMSALIGERKKAVIKLAKQDIIIDALNYYNYQKSFEVYLTKLHKKNDKINPDNPRKDKKRKKLDLRIKKVNGLLDLLKDKKYDAYDEMVVDYHLRSFQNKYSDIRYNDLFVGKSNQNKNGDDNTTFNLAKSSVYRALPSWVTLTIVSMFWSSLYGHVENSADLWFMLASYFSAIIMGTTWGLHNGKQVIAQDLNAVLTTDIEIINNLLVATDLKEEIDAIVKTKTENK